MLSTCMTRDDSHCPCALRSSLRRSRKMIPSRPLCPSVHRRQCTTSAPCLCSAHHDPRYGCPPRFPMSGWHLPCLIRTVAPQRVARLTDSGFLRFELVSLRLPATRAHRCSATQHISILCWKHVDAPSPFGCSLPLQPRVRLHALIS